MMKERKQDEIKAIKVKFEDIANCLQLEGKERTLARIIFKMGWSASKRYHLNQKNLKLY
jgi:hypothetical protein